MYSSGNFVQGRWVCALILSRFECQSCQCGAWKGDPTTLRIAPLNRIFAAFSLPAASASGRFSFTLRSRTEVTCMPVSLPQSAILGLDLPSFPVRTLLSEPTLPALALMLPRQLQLTPLAQPPKAMRGAKDHINIRTCMLVPRPETYLWRILRPYTRLYYNLQTLYHTIIYYTLYSTLLYSALLYSALPFTRLD